jgi:hypothetical protein
MTLSEWGKRYFDEMIKPDKASLEWQKLIFKNIEFRLGDKFLDQIDEAIVDEHGSAGNGSLLPSMGNHLKKLGSLILRSTENWPSCGCSSGSPSAKIKSRSFQPSTSSLKNH